LAGKVLAGTGRHRRHPGAERPVAPPLDTHRRRA